MARINETRIEHVRVVKLNLDQVCQVDLGSGNGIRLTSVESFDKKRNNERIPTGLQSGFFGTDFSDEAAFKERYRCACGRLQGKYFSGMTCDVCGTVVDYHDIDLKKTGWIILDQYKCMSPIYQAKLADALGKFEGERVLDKIIEMEYRDGDEPLYTEKEEANLKKHPFIKKGAIWLSEHIDEVLDFYSKRKPGKAKLFNELKREKPLMFTHCIPVFTSLLRTEMPGEKGYKEYKLKINTCYKALIRTVNAINMLSEQISPTDEFGINDLTINSIDILLASIYKEIDSIFEITYTDLTNKNGIITSKVLGGRYNFSARNIIIPSSTSGRLDSDEIEISYVAFMELYRYEIQNLYAKTYGVNPVQANSAWKKAVNHFDEKFYNVIDMMLSDPDYKGHLGVLINRNPSINYGSFIYVNIVKVKKNFSDKTLTISSHILTPMNADFDGDILNVFRIIGEDMEKRFSKNLNPKYNLFVSRMDGLVNKECLPTKDTAVAFWAFNNI